jgi:urea transport system permease protein
LVALWGARPLQAQSEKDAAFQSTLGELRDADYADKEAIVERLIQSGHSSTRAILNAFLEDRLFYRNDNQTVFMAKSTEGDPASWNWSTPDSQGRRQHTGGQLTKIGTNNRLRRVLRTTVARFGLSSPDAAVRLEAVHDMLRSLDEATVAMLRERVDAETDSNVKKAIATGLALADLEGTDSDARIKAVAVLRESLNPDVRNKLASLTEQSPDGSFVESDEKVRTAAASAVKSINQWRLLYSGIETLFFGLSLGSVLVLIAIGLAITFGVMGVINMAHGELMMLGAYTTYVVQQAMPNQIGMSILVAIPAAFIVAALTGVLIERTIIRFLYGRPLETLLATFGVSLILQQLVRSIFSALNREVKTPEWYERHTPTERSFGDYL